MKDKLNGVYQRNKLLTISFICLNLVVGIVFLIWHRFILYMFGDMGFEYRYLFVIGASGLLFSWRTIYDELLELSKAESLTLQYKSGYLGVYYNASSFNSLLTSIGVLLGIFNNVATIDRPILNVIEAIVVLESLLYYCIIKYKVDQFKKVLREKDYEESYNELLTEIPETEMNVGVVLDRVHEKEKARGNMKSKEDWE